MTTIGFLGVGNMGKAIINGISKANIKDIQLAVFDINPVKLKDIKNLTVNICEDETELALCSDYLFLCVKPQIMDEVLKKIASHIRQDTVVVSIAAGIPGEYIQSEIERYKTSKSLLASLIIDKTSVIQVMPNTPLMLGEGAVALAKIEPTTDKDLEFVRNIFATSGKTAVIPIDKMNEVIALNGSSPAFIYLFAKAFIEYGIENGLDSDVCKNLIAQSLIGSAKMITDSKMDVEDLIIQVSSPGGTTLAGLERLYEGKFFEITKNACSACLKRAKELGTKI
ncbi:MAG: pyrroline-5-carboxylate reductase [Oscillospiraceae bacterium]|jgi:pyrroline-5-carboxylate reductase|nr:pyrroline-5-carboxylate reductase [Oscillospiraceae bacterium]